MTAAQPAPFQRAMTQSAIGHVAVLFVCAIALTISQWSTPAKPDEMLVDVSLLLGPPTKGEFGAPNPDALTDQNENRNGVAKTEPAPPPPPLNKETTPPIRDGPVPQPPKLEEPKNPVDPVKPPDPVPVKPPEKDVKKPEIVQNKQPTNKVVQTDKPQKHEVKISKEIVSVAAPKNTTQNKPGPSKTTLSQAQLNQMLTLGLPPSPGGGAGIRGGGAPGSVERGATGNTMELYKSALKARLYHAWTRPPGVDGLRTTIRIIIARDGRIISAERIRRSGNDLMDNSAMQAVRSVTPPRLPDGVTAPYTLEIEFDASGVTV